MKKYLIILITILFVVLFDACSGGKTPQEKALKKYAETQKKNSHPGKKRRKEKIRN